MGFLMLKELSACGYLIFPSENIFILKKVITKVNNKTFPDKEFDTYELAFEYACNDLIQLKQFSAIVRYNRGLGPEYKNLLGFSAETLEDAKNIALIEASKLLGEKNIVEIRVKEICNF